MSNNPFIWHIDSHNTYSDLLWIIQIVFDVWLYPSQTCIVPGIANPFYPTNGVIKAVSYQLTPTDSSWVNDPSNTSMTN